MEKYYEDYDDFNKIQNNTLKITETNEKRIVDFYLINEISNIRDYIDFLRAVDSCRPQDEIIIHINNYGGVMDVAMNIYDSLKLSQSNVTINIEGACCSSASMIMLAGNCWNVYPHSYVMIHAWSGAECGKWNEIKQQYEFDENVVQKQFKELYKDFLTDEEIEDCLKGKDFYFDAEEVIKRLNNYQKDEIEMDKAIGKISEKYSALAQKEVDNFLKKSNKRK